MGAGGAIHSAEAEEEAWDAGMGNGSADTEARVGVAGNGRERQGEAVDRDMVHSNEMEDTDIAHLENGFHRPYVDGVHDHRTHLRHGSPRRPLLRKSFLGIF